LTLELQAAASRRDRAAVEAAFDRVLATPGLQSYDLLSTGVALKERGFPELGERLQLHLLELEPGYPPALYELGATHRWIGRPQRAMAAYRQAVDGAPDNFDYRQALAETLHALGRHAEAEAETDQLQPLTEAHAKRIAVLRSFGLYLKAHPQALAQRILSEIRREYGWIDAQAVAARIADAVAERRPFALIRLGDGEGAFAEVGPEDEVRFAELYGWMRADWVRFLFGPDFDPDATGYTTLTRTLMTAATEADVLGLPYPNWVHHEYHIASPRGVPCVLNIHRNLLAHPPARRPVACDQVVHLQMHNAGLIEPIVRSARRLTVISCLTGLGDLIKARFELEDVRMIAVPKEYTAPHLRDAAHVDGAAFPDSYEATMQALAQPHDGRLFIIAAGTLGKFYAAAIKRHGGIALDLGSLVDGWMRLPSRAGYDDSLAL
jgi:hypothetical protein